MEKESYNIDDILSEVKKRREDQERELRFKNGSSAPNEEKAENEAPDGELVMDVQDEPVKAEEPVEYTKLVEEPINEEVVQEEPEAETAEPEMTEAETAEPEQEDDDTVVDNQLSGGNDGAMVDLLALALEPESITPKQPEQNESEKAVSKKRKTEKAGKKKNKSAKLVITVLIALIIVAVAVGIVYANGLLDKITDKQDADPYEMVTYYNGMDFLQEDFPAIEELSASEVYDYKEYLKQWYQNGDPVSSTHILNVLLIGEDTREENISDTSRADSAIIASINVDTGEIHLTSILRDLYVYYEVDGEGRYGKINESASTGGMECYIKTLERYYKIVINNYAVVNFASFPKIIDALDGVNINITSREINEINNHPKRYGGVTITQSFDGDEGKMTLDGEQALAYCRIRKIDTDFARANRQKTVLTALFKKMRASGAIDTVKVVNELAEYVYTGYSKKELIGLGNTALKDGWLDYEVKTSNIPNTENRKGGQKFSVSPGNWIWLADIPKDAYELQMSIYGKSNIKLNENRPDYIALGR